MKNKRKIISIVLAAAIALMLGGCGKKSTNEKSGIVGDGVETAQKANTDKPKESKASENETASPTIGTGATQAPFTDSYAVHQVDTETIPVSEDKGEFEDNPENSGYKKYVSGDNKWGIQLPEQAVPGDEDESGSIFTIGPNMIAVNTMDEVHEFKTPEEAKEYFSMLDEVKLNNFTVIYNNDEYSGCYFDFQTSIGAWGVCKYAVNGKQAASAVATNMSDDASLNDILRDTVNSLVVLD